jgi:hypothetical protein
MNGEPTLSIETTQRMKTTKIWRAVRLAIVAVGLTGCVSDSATGPATAKAPVVSPQVDAGLLSSLLTPKRALLWDNDLSQDVSVAADIDERGGTLRLAGQGFTLTVPRGAVHQKTHFVVTAVKGSIVAYEMEPHGTTFDVPLVAKQDLDPTTWKPLGGLFMSAGYFTDRSKLLEDLGIGLVSETVQGLTSVLTHEFTFPIKHFSGYLEAW